MQFPRPQPIDVGATVAVLIWLFFQITVKDPLGRPPLLDEAVMLVIGSWVTYRGLKRNGTAPPPQDGGKHRVRD